MPSGVSRSVTDVESGASQVWDATLAESDSSGTEDEEVIVEKTEQPGIDSLRGTFGTVGTIIRNRRRTTALSEAHNRTHVRNRRESEASGLETQSINEEPRQPGEGKDPEKLDLGRKYFGHGARKPSDPTAPALLSVPPRDTHAQSTPSVLIPPSSTSSAKQPVLHSSPESEKPDPVAALPKQTPVLHAHFDLNQQSPTSILQTPPPPPASLTPVSVPSLVDRSDPDPMGDMEKPSLT